MRDVNGFFLFELGQISLLSTLPRDVDLRPSIPIIANIQKGLSEFAEEKGNQEDLPGAVDNAKSIAETLKKLIEKDPYPMINPEEHLALMYWVMTFRDRLAAELGKVYSQVLEEKGGRSVKTLWTKVLSLLPVSVVPHLSDFVKENIEEAGKCWIVDRPTATGFHMMRSVECVLRAYKRLVTGKDVQFTDKRGTVRYQGFGTIINDLLRSV
jgi:hypothetical protein